MAQAARYLVLPEATLRSWTRGRSYPTEGGKRRSQPLIRLPDEESSALSFYNLIEAHVLKAIRRAYKVPMSRIREALSYAEERLEIERLLLRKDLLASPGNLFLEHMGDLVNLSRSGQLAMRRILEAHLSRVEHDDDGRPVRFYPMVGGALSGPRNIVIDPRLSFGRAAIAKAGVSTSILKERVDAGEDPEKIAVDYDLEEKDVEEAIVFELAA